MKVAIYIDAAKAMMVGKNVRSGRHIVDVDPSSLTDDERQWLASQGSLSKSPERNKRGECDLCLDPPINWYGTYAAEACEGITEPTVEEIRRAIARSKARMDADVAAAEEKKRQYAESLTATISAIIDQGPQALVVEDRHRAYRVDGEEVAKGVRVASHPQGESLATHPLWSQYSAVIAAAKGIADSRNEEIQAVVARLEAEHAAKQAANEAERVAWIKAHGSSRLKRLLAEGIAHGAVYRDERLAAERPGWEWYTSVPGVASDPRNPPEEALDLLDEARKTDPSAKLQYYTAKADMDDDGEDIPAVRGYVAEAEFLGRLIVYGVDRCEEVEA